MLRRRLLRLLRRGEWSAREYVRRAFDVPFWEMWGITDGDVGDGVGSANTIAIISIRYPPHLPKWNVECTMKAFLAHLAEPSIQP